MGKGNTLLDVCSLIIDCEHKTAPTQATGYPSIRTPNLGRGYFLLDGVNRVSEETYQLWTRRAVPQYGDLIMAREAPVGNVAMVPQGLKPCLGQRTLLIRPDPAKVHPRYLTYLLVGDEIQGVIHGQTNGATVPHLNMKDVRSLPLPTLPDLCTQRKIAGVLSAYDDLIENNTRRIAILEEMAQAIYREWFVNFRFPGHEKVKLVNSPLGKIPDGWRKAEVNDLCDTVRAGGTPRRNEPSFWNDGAVDWYKTKELQDGFLFSSEEKISEIAATNSTTRLFDTNTLLMAIYGSPTVGRLGILTKRSACNQAALAMTPNSSKASLTYLYFVLMGLREHFNTIAMGAAQQNISKEKVILASCLLPHRDVITHFDSHAEPMFSLIKALSKKNHRLRHTRDLLLPKLISGQLNVEELEIETGEPLVEAEA